MGTYIRLTLQSLLPLLLVAAVIIFLIAGIYHGVCNNDVKAIACIAISAGALTVLSCGKWNQY